MFITENMFITEPNRDIFGADTTPEYLLACTKMWVVTSKDLLTVMHYLRAVGELVMDHCSRGRGCNEQSTTDLRR